MQSKTSSQFYTDYLFVFQTCKSNNKRIYATKIDWGQRDRLSLPPIAYHDTTVFGQVIPGPRSDPKKRRTNAVSNTIGPAGLKAVCSLQHRDREQSPVVLLIFEEAEADVQGSGRELKCIGKVPERRELHKERALETFSRVSRSLLNTRLPKHGVKCHKTG